ncbi:hypothetical protein MSG28_016194 [Choristoneura fumiferana]|uniref:Uncharacterized protein n=1 Tax=Choristoneura fumiferana TaxID=7141 RepID=A0ACC0K5R2_CHOFU|nr:hypothetical protein MSG28_016194 [Choristoneura fumiferana]
MKREEEEILGEQRRIEKQKKKCRSMTPSVMLNSRMVHLWWTLCCRAPWSWTWSPEVQEKELILGVIRLQQQGAALAADGSVDGLPPGKHGLHLREAGDLSQRHMQRHRNVKHYQCLVCRSKFSNDNSLKVHMKTIHSREKPYECTTCDSKFNNGGELKKHQKKHSELKQRTCTVCNTKFSSKSYLQIHQRIHTGEKPYGCSTCESKFSRKSLLIVHMKIHSQKKP